MAEYIEREAVLAIVEYIRTKYIESYNRRNKYNQFWADTIRYFEKKVKSVSPADVVDLDTMADILDELFGSEPPCDFKDNDEWLGEFCETAQCDCPCHKETKSSWKRFILASIDRKEVEGE